MTSMVSSSKFESLALRHAPYVEELQEFYRSRKMSYGTPADLDTFLARLKDPAFHEEMVSMVRSILYREDEALPRTELLDIVARSVAGSQIDEAAPGLHEALRRILAFVSEIIRCQRLGIAVDAPEDDSSVGDAVAASAETSSPSPFEGVPATALNEPARILPPSAAISQEDLVQAQALPNARLSRVLAGSEESEAGLRPVTSEGATSPRIPWKPQTAQPAAPARISPARGTSLGAFLRRAYWIPGVCVLLAVLLVAFLLRKPGPAVTSIATAPAPILAAPVHASKPSAYGPMLGNSAAASSMTPSTAPLPAPAALPPANPSRGRLSTSPGEGLSAAAAPHVMPRAALGASHVTPRALGGREGVFLASSGMMASHLLTAPAPEYPKLASLTHVQGEVIVQVVVGRDGAVEATRILEGPHLLRGAAEHAIRRWRYRPYLVDGKPTDVATIVTVNFRLTP